MITFSFKPLKSSIFPDTAASVSTFVVSWKLAAEMKLSVHKEALVIPKRMGLAVAGLESFSRTRSFSFLNFDLSTC